jgi:hypothetical protein
VAHGEKAAALARHGQVLGRLADEAEQAYWASADSLWWKRYARDMDDLEAAFARACERRDAEVASATGQVLFLLDEMSASAVRSAKRRRPKAAYALLPVASARARARIWGWLAASAASWPIEACGVSRTVAASEAVAEWRKFDDRRCLYLALGRNAGEFANSGNLEFASDPLAEAARIEDALWPPRLRWSFADDFSMVSICRGDASTFRSSVELDYDDFARHEERVLSLSTKWSKRHGQEKH